MTIDAGEAAIRNVIAAALAQYNEAIGRGADALVAMRQAEVAESSVALPPDPQSWSALMSGSSPHDSDVPRPDCPTCGTQMWIVMAPPLPVADVKEDWLFRCPVCKVIVPVAQT